MSTFNLTNTATQVDTAIQAVVGADTAPTDASFNMVTSGGVKTYVDNAVGDLGSKTVTTESVGIAATDNDTSVPTSAAVKDYVDTQVQTFGASILRTSVFETSSTSYQTVPVSHAGSPSFLSLSNNVATVTAGTYIMKFHFEYSDTGNRQDNGYGAYFKVEQVSGVDFHGLTGDYQTGAGTNYASGTTYGRRSFIDDIITVSSTSSFRLRFRSDFRTSDTHRIRNLQWHFLKLY
jgi:hypothetical protein